MEMLTVKSQSRASVFASFPKARSVAEDAMRVQKEQSSQSATGADHPQSASRRDWSSAKAMLGLAVSVLCSLVALALLILFVLEIWVVMPIASSPVVPQTPDENCGHVESDVPTVPDIRGTPARLGPAFTC